MRTMMRVTVPVTTGNKTIQDGTLPRTLQATLEALKPEAVYFTVVDGERTAFIYFDLAEPSRIPVICEPLFTNLDAKIELTPVMSAQDLQAGLKEVAQAR